MKKIYVSPSDQVENKYAYGNTNEAVVCREIAGKLCSALERCGFETKTDYQDGSNAMYERCRQSDEWGADMHIPIHTNACNGQVTGTRIFSYNYTGESYKASKCVFDALAPVTPGTSESISAYSALYEIRVPKAVSVYVEAEFHDVLKTAKWLIENTDAVAEAICKGVCNYYKVAYVDPKPAESDTLYRVQVGAFRVKENAEKMLADLKKAGFDGFIVGNGAATAPSETPKPTKKSIEEVAQEIVYGNPNPWGNGTDRTQNLTAAGYTAEEREAIQKRVNQLLK